MKRQYLYLMTLIGGTLSYTIGAEQTPNKGDEPDTKGRGVLSSSASVGVEDAPHRRIVQAPPPQILSVQLPPYKRSAPRPVPEPADSSPAGRVLKTRTNHPSGDFSSATPKYPPDATHKPQPKNFLKESSAGDEEPPIS